MLKFSKAAGVGPEVLGAEAALNAMDEAQVSIKDIQALYAGSAFSGGIAQRLQKMIGQTGIPSASVSNACATGATAFREAMFNILAGDSEITLAVGCEVMPRGLLGGAADNGVSAEGLIGSASMPAVFAESGQEHAAKYGTTFAQFAKVSVKNHHHSTFNPKAIYQKETPLEEVMGAEMIAYPNTKLMCSVNVDGAAAAVVMSEREAKRRGLMNRAVKVRASALASDAFQRRNPTMWDVNTATRMAADWAYEKAGLGPDDVDLVELHDCFATAELLHYENLRLCGPGEAGRMIDTGETAIGGRIPVNLSGGLLSKGHPIAATGIANLYELSCHLRGVAGVRQVPGARIGLAHVVGLGTVSAVHILEKAN
ncbi:MAG: thiolase family protein [Caulobacteraceae bacterium]|nr:thiolase family protein [Caulobacteraceae bacterium]